MSHTPASGEVWRHYNGNLYRVLMIVNYPDEERYPKTVVYENISTGSQRARRFDDRHRSFSFESTI